MKYELLLNMYVFAIWILMKLMVIFVSDLCGVRFCCRLSESHAGPHWPQVCQQSGGNQILWSRHVSQTGVLRVEGKQEAIHGINWDLLFPASSNLVSALQYRVFCLQYSQLVRCNPILIYYSSTDFCEKILDFYMRLLDTLTDILHQQKISVCSEWI